MFYLIKQFFFNIKKQIVTIILTTVTILTIFPLIIQFSSKNNKYFLFIIFLGLILYFIFSIKLKEFIYLSLTRNNQESNWFGKGNNLTYDPTNKNYTIKGNPGAVDAFSLENIHLLKYCVNWIDYKVSFDFQLKKTCLGVVFRAVDSSNFIMFQINNDSIKPHIKINENWGIPTAEENIHFGSNLEFYKWYKFLLICNGNMIDYVIYYKDNLFSKYKKFSLGQWPIPPRLTKLRDPENGNAIIDIPPYIVINFNNGTFGFRNSNHESAAIKNLLISKLTKY